jgi:DNA-binding NarL/FixJ family response regulator
MDIALPVLGGLEATRLILRRHPLTKVLMLSAHDDAAYIQRATELGAAGYLLKQSCAGLLSNAIRAVQRGRVVLGSSEAKRLRRPAKMAQVSKRDRHSSR